MDDLMYGRLDSEPADGEERMDGGQQVTRQEGAVGTSSPLPPRVVRQLVPNDDFG